MPVAVLVVVRQFIDMLTGAMRRSSIPAPLGDAGRGVTRLFVGVGYFGISYVAASCAAESTPPIVSEELIVTRPAQSIWLLAFLLVLGGLSGTMSWRSEPRGRAVLVVTQRVVAVVAVFVGVGLVTVCVYTRAEFRSDRVVFDYPTRFERIRHEYADIIDIEVERAADGAIAAPPGLQLRFKGGDVWSAARDGLHDPRQLNEQLLAFLQVKAPHARVVTRK